MRDRQDARERGEFSSPRLNSPQRRATALRLEQVQVPRAGHGIAPARRTELAVDALGVRLDRVARDPELAPDLPRRKAAGEETQHRLLSCRELVGCDGAR